MPSIDHEIPLRLLQERPEVLLRLLREGLGVALPPYQEIRAEKAELSALSPVERRADMVFTLRREGAAVLGLIVEVQLAPDPRKSFTWPEYVGTLHSALQCDTYLVVLAPDAGVARWARAPIRSFQPNAPFVPLVVGPETIPRVESAEEARAAPELAVLSAVTHARKKGDLSLARVALSAVSGLDEERAKLYFDFIFFSLGGALRRHLEAEMELGKYEYKSDFAKKYIAIGRAEGRAEGEAEGEAKGKAEGKAEAILAVLAARGLSISEAVREKVLGCRDLPTLERWLVKAATAKSAAQAVAQRKAPAIPKPARRNQ
jgi:hypothetical protein